MTPKAYKGLVQFREDYPEAKLHLLYFGTHKEYHNSINVVPFEQALQLLPEIL